MNRGQNVVWATAAAALTALALVVVLFAAIRGGNMNPEINLPPDPSEMSAPSALPWEDIGEWQLTQNLVEVTTKNFAKIIEDLSRPAEYTAVSSTVLRWEGGTATKTFRLNVLGDCSRVDEYDTAGRLLSTVIYTPETVYLPLGGQDQPVPRGEFSLDAATSMPTYEDVLTLGNVTDAGYVRRNDRPCVWVLTQDGDYDIEYWVDMENGLLTAASASQNGVHAWEYELNTLVIDTPESDMFMLPSGVSALDS